MFLHLYGHKLASIVSMKLIKSAVILLVFSSSFSRAQGLKNADYSGQTPTETGKLADGTSVNYYATEGVAKRALVGKEFIYYKTVIEGAINSLDAGWINSPNWKRKYEWNYGEKYENGLNRLKSEDEKNYPNEFLISNVFQPAKGHPLYQFMLNKNDSLYQPMTAVTKPRDYLKKVQEYENNSPRMTINLHINDLFKANSIAAFTELDWKIKLKTPYKIYQRNDSIWYKNLDVSDQDAADMRFQKNTVYVVIGNPKSVDFSKGMSDGIQEYHLTTYPNKEQTALTRVDFIIIELTGHDESIKLFFDKIDWKKMDVVFKTKIK